MYHGRQVLCPPSAAFLASSGECKSGTVTPTADSNEDLGFWRKMRTDIRDGDEQDPIVTPFLPIERVRVHECDTNVGDRGGEGLIGNCGVLPNQGYSLA